MGFLTIKAFHIIFMVTWFAGLFYLPRLFVYHASAEDTVGIERFKIMERKLLWNIATPGALLTLVFGFWLLALYPDGALEHLGWLQWKLALVVLLIAYHGGCIVLWLDFSRDRNRRSHLWYRWFNEAPVLLLVAIVLLVVLKPGTS
jgi:putative membrane protein